MLIERGKQLIEPRKNFMIRLSEEERRQAEHDARSSNMKASDYVRYLITHAGKADTSFAYDRRDLIRQISCLCNNYHQMTKTTNGCGYVFDNTMKDANYLMEQIKEKMKELADKWR